MMDSPTAFFLTDSVIDEVSLEAGLGDSASGAAVVFAGRVRDHHEGRAVDHLEYHAYHGVCERIGSEILRDAITAFHLRKAIAVHRIGPLGIGDTALWVGVSSAHRKEAFEACAWIVDEIKRRLPVWKKELFAEGDAAWVHEDAFHDRPVPTHPEPGIDSGAKTNSVHNHP